jgi:hypothetical protein
MAQKSLKNEKLPIERRVFSNEEKLYQSKCIMGFHFLFFFQKPIRNSEL